MFGVREKVDERWIGNWDEEDGLFTGNWRGGRVKRLQQHYGLMRELSIVGGRSTGNRGGRVYGSNPTDPTQYVEHSNPQLTSYFN